MAEEHAVGGSQGQRVARGFFPGQVPGTLHQLAILHAGELREGTVRGFITPDALRRREHRIAAIALFVIAVILIAMHDHFVADLPARHLGAHGPHNPGCIRACDMKRIFVPVDGRDWRTERRPDAVVIDTRRHHENQHIMRIERPGRNDLDLHRRFGRAVPVLPDSPRIHILRHVTERRNFADFIEILVDFKRTLRFCRHPLNSDDDLPGLETQPGRKGANLER